MAWPRSCAPPRRSSSTVRLMAQPRPSAATSSILSIRFSLLSGEQIVVELGEKDARAWRGLPNDQDFVKFSVPFSVCCWRRKSSHRPLNLVETIIYRVLLKTTINFKLGYHHPSRPRYHRTRKFVSPQHRLSKERLRSPRRLDLCCRVNGSGVLLARRICYGPDKV